MPVVGTPVQALPVTNDDIRGFLRDVAGQIPNTGVINVLLDNVEFSDKDINRAITYTVGRYNAITPITFVDVNFLNQYVLLVGTASFLLKSEAMRQLRNQITAQDADIAPIGMDDKQALYAQMAKMMDDEFMMLARGIKTQLNMESAYGSFGSGYKNVARNHNF
jgi:hypothetical protein